MDVPANGLAEEQDDQRRVDQKDIFYRVILFLATVTFRLFSSVLGADDAPFRPVMGTVASLLVWTAPDGIVCARLGLSLNQDRSHP